MSEREQYPAGVPCWVELLQPDPHTATAFYGPLFGWEFVGPGAMPGDPPGEYFVAQVRGRDIAGIGSAPARTSSAPPAWTTHVRVDSADEATERTTNAGGSLLDGPFDALPAGRMAVLADPTGAEFCVWEARAREGAQLVNEPRAWSMSLLNSPNPDVATAFYSDVFGWQTEPFGPPAAQMTLWRLPGYVGGEPQQPVPRDVVGVMIPGTEEAQWSIDFWVDDADTAAELAAGLGGSVVVPPRDIPGFRNAVLADPQGAAFSVSQLVAGP
jgi:predicted enzyme related to lactoylglutathione lyase